MKLSGEAIKLLQVLKTLEEIDKSVCAPGSGILGNIKYRYPNIGDWWETNKHLYEIIKDL